MVTLAGEASDDLEIEAAEVSADDEQVATFTESPFTTTWDLTSVRDGTHVLKAAVRDRAGKRVESAVLEVTVDNEKPSLTVTAVPSEVAAEGTRMIPVEITVTSRDNRDPAPNFRLVSITAEGPVIDGDVADAEVGVGDRAFQLRARPNPPGQPSRVYTITYEARDRAGNTRRATTRLTVLGAGEGRE